MRTTWFTGPTAVPPNCAIWCASARAIIEPCTKATSLFAFSLAGPLEFRSPNGLLLPAVPPVPQLPVAPVRDLMNQHEAVGIEIDAWTSTPDWHGERLDLDWAIRALWRPSTAA
jgi:hypothetical protein